VFLNDCFRLEAPEIQALLSECSAIKALDLKLPPTYTRGQNFKEDVLEWSQRLFDVAPSELTSLRAPITHAQMDDGLAFSRFTKLENLTMFVGAGVYDESGQVPWTTATSTQLVSRSVMLIDNVLANLPLRTLTVCAGALQESRYVDYGSQLKLTSDTLESFTITGSKTAYVSKFRCPNLKTLLLDYFYCLEDKIDTVWDALQSGVHSLDLTTMPAGHKENWCRFGFKDGVFGDSDQRFSQLLANSL